MRAVDVVSLMDPTASIFEENGLYTVRGIFANGTGFDDGIGIGAPTRKWGTGFFPSQDAAWNAAIIQLDALNSGRFN